MGHLKHMVNEVGRSNRERVLPAARSTTGFSPLIALN